MGQTTWKGYLMNFTALLANPVYLWVFIAVTLQIAGTLILGLFSFNGIKITSSPNVYVNNKPVTHTSIDPKWLVWAQRGLLMLLVGITISGIATLATL